MTDWMQFIPTTGVFKEQTRDGTEEGDRSIVLSVSALLVTETCSISLDSTRTHLTLEVNI